MADQLIIVASGFVLLCGTYLVFPSRWNIPAHVAVGFWAVAYVVPVMVVGTQVPYPRATVSLFANVMGVGALLHALGIWVGYLLSKSVSRRPAPGRGRRTREADGLLGRWGRLDDDVSSPLGARLFVLSTAAMCALLFSIVYMGFVPMFSDDPFAAKFFRGQYAEAYRPVAPLFRLGTAILAVTIPLLAAFAIYRRKIGKWHILTLVAVGLMIVTLQRGPAVSGLILTVGTVMVARRRLWPFVVLTVLVYVGGAAFYAVLTYVGILRPDTAALTLSYSETIARTAPDVSDALTFLGRWEQFGQPYTYGRTFVGGLIPGNYPWNPGVWTLTLGSPYSDLDEIRSGGLRLPSPVWGLVAFGWVGVVLVPFVSGLVAGGLTRSLRAALVGRSGIIRVGILCWFQVLTSLLVNFYSLTYIAVFQLCALLWLSRAAAPTEEGMAARSSPSLRPRRASPKARGLG